MRTKIYTKVGDKGETALLSGTYGGGSSGSKAAKVSKGDNRLRAYGTIDELNAALGLAAAEIHSNFQLRPVATVLEKNQHLLFVVGSHLACIDENLREKLPPLPEAAVTQLEAAIDELETLLPELKEFILPGGARGAATVHLARTICRRAEREVVGFVDSLKKKPVAYLEAIKYLNRLGDYLFVAARFINVEQKVPEIKWVKP